jgi:hypothetical protein
MIFSPRYQRRRRDAHANRMQVENAVRQAANLLGIVTWSIMGRKALLVYPSADRARVHEALRSAFATEALKKCLGPSGGVLWGPNWCKCVHPAGVILEITEE